MGQQQLLLIVLGVIVAGLAIVVGLDMFTSSASELNRDQVISDLMYLSTDAQAYYRKESEFGGGNGSFQGYTIPEFYRRYGGGRIRVRVRANRDKVILTGIGTEIGLNGSSKVRVKSIVKPDQISIRILN